MKTVKKAFTLVELLIVIAIIGILTALIVPALSDSKTKVAKMQTKTFLTSLTSGLDMYRNEYGSFPIFLTQRERINLNNGNYAEYLVKTLSGKSAEGNKLSTADRKNFNRNATNFLSFTDDNLMQLNGSTRWSLIDAFGNPNIYICVDDAGDTSGKIKKGYPTTADGISKSEYEELVPNKSAGISAYVIAFTLRKDSERADADYSAENVFSWK